MLDGYDADVTLKVAVVVGDESIHVDYAGTSDQIAMHPSTAARTTVSPIPSTR